MQIGIEFEFNYKDGDYKPLFDLLDDNDISYRISFFPKSVDLEKLLFKPEMSTSGIEMTVPPTYTEQELIKLLSVLNNDKNIIFKDKCALHIHVSDDRINSDTLDEYYEYYASIESRVIQEATNRNLYINLNASNNKISIDTVKQKMFRKINLNVFRSYEQHKTIEHRIYKCSLNYEDVKFCIDQTKKIINKEY